MAEINLTFNLPGITAEQLAPVISSLTTILTPLLGAGAVAPPEPVVVSSLNKDPEEFISLKTAAAEGPLSSYCLRERIVDGKEIPYSRKGKAPKSPIIIKRKHLWLLFPDLTAAQPEDRGKSGRPGAKTTAEDIALGNC